MKALALVAVVATLVPTSAGAQALAEAARRAEDARKGSTASPVLTDKDLPSEAGISAGQISAHELNDRNFQAFMSTRRAYVKMLIADSPLRARMQARMAQAKSIDSAVAIWNGEEAVLALIRENGTNPREFLLTELAVAHAVLVLKKTMQGGPAEALPPAVEHNVAFVRIHWPEIESFAREIQALASQMP